MEAVRYYQKTMSDTNKTAVSTKDAPAAIGPYSQAIRVGDTLYTSARLRWIRRLELWSRVMLKEQTKRVLENLKAVLGAAGAGTWCTW